MPNHDTTTNMEPVDNSDMRLTIQCPPVCSFWSMMWRTLAVALVASNLTLTALTFADVRAGAQNSSRLPEGCDLGSLNYTFNISVPDDLETYALVHRVGDDAPMKGRKPNLTPCERALTHSLAEFSLTSRRELKDYNIAVPFWMAALGGCGPGGSCQ